MYTPARPGGRSSSRGKTCSTAAIATSTTWSCPSKGSGLDLLRRHLALRPLPFALRRVRDASGDRRAGIFDHTAHLWFEEAPLGNGVPAMACHLTKEERAF